MGGSSWHSDVSPMLPPPVERRSSREIWHFLERFVVLYAYDEIAAPLRLGGRGDDHAESFSSFWFRQAA